MHAMTFVPNIVLVVNYYKGPHHCLCMHLLKPCVACAYADCSFLCHCYCASLQILPRCAASRAQQLDRMLCYHTRTGMVPYYTNIYYNHSVCVHVISEYVLLCNSSATSSKQCLTQLCDCQASMCSTMLYSYIHTVAVQHCAFATINILAHCIYCCGLSTFSATSTTQSCAYAYTCMQSLFCIPVHIACCCMLCC